MNDKKVRIAVTVLVALAIAAFAFVAGFLTERCFSDRALSSYEWALRTIKEYYYFDEPDSDYTETSLKVIADTYLDRYSEYYTKEEYEEVQKSNAGSKSGIGISYSFVNGRGVFISRVVGNSPAYAANLRAGDYILSGSIEGGKEEKFTSSTSFANFISSAKDGAKITLTADDGKTYTVAKSEYTASYASMVTSTVENGKAVYKQWTVDPVDGTLGFSIDYTYSYLPEGCAYLKLDQFYGSATNEFYTLIEQFNALECTSLILDLRSNGGGYVSIMQDIAGCFAGGKSQLAMLSRDKKGAEEKYNCRKVTDEKRRIENKNVFVLANAGTASASEALIGAMVCYGALDYKNIFLSRYSDEYINWLYPTGQDIKNGRTYGKGIMQTPFTNYMTGEVLKLTTAKIFWPDKTTSIHDRGLTVEGDGCTAVPAEWEWTKGDEELQTAVEMIKKRISA